MTLTLLFTYTNVLFIQGSGISAMRSASGKSMLCGARLRLLDMIHYTQPGRSGKRCHRRPGLLFVAVERTVGRGKYVNRMSLLRRFLGSLSLLTT